MRFNILLLFLCEIIVSAFARNHTLLLQNDRRRLIDFSGFGYLKGEGTLAVLIQNLTLQAPYDTASNQIGFSLVKGAERNDYLKKNGQQCALRSLDSKQDPLFDVVTFKFDFAAKLLRIKRISPKLKDLLVCSSVLSCYPDTNLAQPKPVTNQNTTQTDHIKIGGKGNANARRKRQNSVENGLVDQALGGIPAGDPFKAAVPKHGHAINAPPGNGKQPISKSPSITAPNTNKPQQKLAEKGQNSMKSGEAKVPLKNTVPPIKNVKTATDADAESEEEEKEDWFADDNETEQAEAKVNQSTERSIAEVTDHVEIDEVGTSTPTNNKALAHSQVTELPLIYDETSNSWSTRFAVRFLREEEQGFYVLFLHNCMNYGKLPSKQTKILQMTTHMVERNGDSYLPAGDLQKPNLYFMLSVLFLGTALVWISLVHSKKDAEVYRVHYLMTAVIFLKCLSLFFHGVNYYFISMYGHQKEVWAVVYYVMHLLKGALLFGVIILIGTGYTFFKNFLTERDRKLFMLVLPLQVIDNIALIIVAESEEGSVNYRFWLQLFVLVDLMCCVFIIFPVVWSIRHLSEASRTDGKAAFSVEKLKLFRQFYIMIIVYIYVTRVIKMLATVTAPFQYGWVEVVVTELGTWFFFVVAGYKFRPMTHNPYLKLDQTDDMEMEESVTQSGVLDGITRLKRPNAASVLSTALQMDSDQSTDSDNEHANDDVLFATEHSLHKTNRSMPPPKPDGSGPDIY